MKNLSQRNFKKNVSVSESLVDGDLNAIVIKYDHARRTDDTTIPVMASLVT